MGFLLRFRDKSRRAVNLCDFTYHDDKATLEKLGRKNAWELRAKAGAVLGEKEERIVRLAVAAPPTPSVDSWNRIQHCCTIH